MPPLSAVCSSDGEIRQVFYSCGLREAECSSPALAIDAIHSCLVEVLLVIERYLFRYFPPSAKQDTNTVCSK